MTLIIGKPSGSLTNFYPPTRTLPTSTDGQQAFGNTNAGNGVAGFVFVVDAAERAALSQTIFSLANVGSIVLSLNSSLTGATGGPESFTIVKLGGTPRTGGDVPEPGTVWLCGLACMLAAFGFRNLGRAPTRG